jgi:hypothetical protein
VQETGLTSEERTKEKKGKDRRDLPQVLGSYLSLPLFFRFLCPSFQEDVFLIVSIWFFFVFVKKVIPYRVLLTSHLSPLSSLLSPLTSLLFWMVLAFVVCISQLSFRTVEA